jgi:hypothetical protein
MQCKAKKTCAMAQISSLPSQTAPNHLLTYASFMLANPELEVGRRPNQVLRQVIVELHEFSLQCLHSFGQIALHWDAQDFGCTSVAVEEIAAGGRVS